jgi:hypothetical protein
MGIRGSLQEITFSSFEKIKKGEETTPDNFLGEYFSLDKAWYGIYLLFMQKEYPLTLILNGDFHPSFYPYDFDIFINNKEEKFRGWYVGFSSPELVNAISKALADVSDEEIKSICDRIGLDYDFYFQSYLDELRNAYNQCSKNGNALYITIS